MKQTSVSIPDHVADAVAKLAIATGQSQSQLCCRWIEEGLAREIKRIEAYKKIEDILVDSDM